MMKCRLLLVGIGGYGVGTLRAILDKKDRPDVVIEGIVEPYPDSCPFIDEVVAKNHPVYDTMDAFYARHAADLAVISSPIQFHAEQALVAFANGSHVLLEKPVAADMDGANAILQASKKANKRCAVGYQWCFNPAMLALKKDILAGEFGRPVSMRSITLWPRDEQYYRRGIGWAGKRKDASGRAVNDSVASNATAHYLMNMLWLLGDKMDAAADLQNMESATLRVNPIETFDTALIGGEAGGAQVMYIASHAIDAGSVHEPEFEYVFEKGVVHYSGTDPDGFLVAHMNDGSIRQYAGMSRQDEDRIKLWTTIDALPSGVIPATVETAAAHTRVMETVNARPTLDFTAVDRHAFDAEKRIHYLPDLSERLLGCYRSFGPVGESVLTGE